MLDHMTEPQESVSAPPRPLNRQRLGRAWTTTAVVIVALIVLAAAVVVFATRDPDKRPPAAAPPSSRSAGPSSAGPSSAGTPGSPPPALDQTVPVSAPKGITWVLFQGVALPSSRAAGPTRVAGPVYAGYAHTPVGALIASAQIGARHLIAPGNDWRQVVAQQIVPTVGREAFITARAAVTTTDVAPGTYGQLAGFRFVTYSPDTAVIQFVTRFRNGNLQVSTTTVRWVNGDWKQVLQLDGSESPTVQHVSSLAGFVPWGGV
jgi:hypothetical protein